MSGPSQSPIHYGYASPSDMNWSKSEKAIARQAFDAALASQTKVPASSEMNCFRHLANFHFEHHACFALGIPFQNRRRSRTASFGLALETGLRPPASTTAALHQAGRRR